MHVGIRRAALAALLAFGGMLSAHAQEYAIPPVQWPAIPERVDTAQGFVPDGWWLEYHVEGRLDDDARPDLLVLLRMQDPANIIEHDGLGMSPFDTNPRMLVIALADADGGYRRALVDHALIPRPESPVLADVLQDDPASVIRITDNRAFSITLHSWASAGTWFTANRSFTFRHQDGCFRLIGFDQSSLHRASGETEETSINYLTGRAWTRSGNIADDVQGTRQSRRLASRSQECLGNIHDGFAFDPGLPAD
jgi:hypothetical protein